MARKPEPYIHPELQNLADGLDEEKLGEIAAEAIEGFKDDWASASEWRKMHAAWTRLYFQKDKPLNPPWQGSAAESMPTLAEACTQFHARSKKALFPGRKIVTARPIGKPDPKSRERAERVGMHMSWQLGVKDRRYRRNKSRMLLSLPLHGSFFTKSYYCPIRKRNIVDNVRAVDLVVAYGTGPRDLEDIERKTQIIHMPINRAKAHAAKKFFIAEPEVFVGTTEGSRTDVDEAHDDIMGLQEPGYGKKTYARILEQHTMLDLDGDGYSEPYIVHIDAQTEQVLRIAIRYDTDERGQPIADKEPVEYFTHYSFLENPDGFYSLGYGHLIGQLNIAVNKLLRQTIDAGTLSTVGNHSGFINNQLSTKKGELEFKLGKFVQTTSTMDDINKGVFQFKFPGPSPATFQQLELLLRRSDRLATVTEAITGQTEKVMQPTTVLALIEQSLEVFSSAQDAVIDSWGMELEKLFRLNGKFMDPEEYFAVLDVSGELQEGSAGREDYEDDLQIQPIADPKMSTEQQKLAKSDAEFQTSMQNPLVMNSPMHLYNAFKRRYESLGVEAIDEIMPKPSQELPRVDDPMQENMGALSPVPMVPPAYMDQDHLAHIKAHQALLEDPVYGMRLSEYGIQELQQHIDAHAAMMYGQTEGIGGLESMGGMPGNGGVPPAATGEVPTNPGVAASRLMGEGLPTEGAGPGAGNSGGIP